MPSCWWRNRVPQLLSYQRGEQPPLIWLSEQAAYQRQQSVRGGCRCAGPGSATSAATRWRCGRSTTTAPRPSTAACALDWQPQGIDSEGGPCTCASPSTAASGRWPTGRTRPARRLDIRLDERLHLDLTSHNLGPAPLALSQALHSYFAVSDIRQVAVRGLDGRCYIETLEDWRKNANRANRASPARPTASTWTCRRACTCIDAGWRRELLLETRGSRSAILYWNPWIDKAQRLSAFAADAWQRMLCIETANVWDDCVELAPGESHRLGPEPVERIERVKPRCLPRVGTRPTAQYA